MRHLKKHNKLSRTSSHRKAMLANMACSLIMHKRVNTTLAKAKQLRVFIEPLLTRSKEDTTHSRRMVFRRLQDKHAVNELFREIAPKIADRPGGYTRILKTGTRLGDAADMCFIELVDYNETYTQAKDVTKKQKSRRSRRGGRKKTGIQKTDSAQKEVIASEPDTKENKDKSVDKNSPKKEKEDKTD